MLRTQKGEETKEEARAREIAAREQAAAEKKAAKAERGFGKKKGGGASRGCEGRGGSGGAAAAAAAAAGGNDDDDDEGDGEEYATRAEARKADKGAAARGPTGARGAARGAEGARGGEDRGAGGARRGGGGEQRAKEEEEARLAEEEARRRPRNTMRGKQCSGGRCRHENPENAQDEAVLVRFIKHVMDNKVVQLDELGGEFSLRVHEIIARVGALEAMGYLSGVTDDRGKFIYVSKDELQAVAKFIGRKGRVRIAALAQESNKLIDLQPRQVAVVDDDEGGEGEGGEAPVGS